MLNNAFKTPDVDSLLVKMVSSGTITDPDCAKGKLLNCAAHLFKTKGFARTTVRDIAREVGILSGSIFHHFPNKESILCGAIREAVLITTEKMRTALEHATTTRERLLSLIQCELEAIHGLSGEGFSLLVNEWRSLNDENQSDLLSLRNDYEQLWIDVLDEAREIGLISVDSFVVRRLMLGSLSYTYNWFNLNGDLSLDELSLSVLKLITKET